MGGVPPREFEAQRSSIELRSVVARDARQDYSEPVSERRLGLTPAVPEGFEEADMRLSCRDQKVCVEV
jgi:hypothetical protein